MVFANPHHVDILRAPFAVPVEVDKFILELMPISETVAEGITISHRGISGSLYYFSLAIFFIYLLVRSIVEKSFEPGRFVIALGGWFLLTKGGRFVVEWALLCMPFMVYVLRRLEVSPRRISASVGAFALVGLLIIPLATFGKRAWEEVDSPVPFDSIGLPVATMDFLEAVSDGVNVLAEPNVGGYVQWRLGKRGKIWIDMEFPPSNAFDLYRVNSAFDDPAAFERLAEEHPVDFVLVMNPGEEFRNVVNELDYMRLVFL